MSISRQNLSIVIVTLKSEKVINKCINSIDQNVPIIVVENSDNQKFKHDLESKYQNLKCILSGSNLGMGVANNIGIKSATTDFVFILNPDVTLEPNTLEKKPYFFFFPPFSIFFFFFFFFFFTSSIEVLLLISIAFTTGTAEKKIKKESKYLSIFFILFLHWLY